MATYTSAYTGAEIDTAVQKANNLLNIIYPVGSIYMSVNNVSPATFIGGTWEPIEGQFLLGQSSTHAAGSTGGEETHQLTEDELPNIVGTVMAGGGNTGTSAGGYGAFRSSSGYLSVYNERQYGQPSSYAAWPSSAAAYANFRIDFGNDVAHNNMPPYLAVYIWKRTA